MRKLQNQVPNCQPNYSCQTTSFVAVKSRDFYLNFFLFKLHLLFDKNPHNIAYFQNSRYILLSSYTNMASGGHSKMAATPDSWLVSSISDPLKHLQSGAKILETLYLLPPSPLKQCCNNDSMPPSLLKWPTQHCLWGEGENDQ